ncbi:MAG TPA: dihydroorotate dehydrogenase [Rectinemataceae bacterium]|nr:dihydroorotate dehydrogenase [Rectinemataceae bacterium]
MKPDLRVRLGPLLLPNPVGVASGTFGYGSEYEQLVDVDSLGALYTKAVTPEPRAGNHVPRIVETPSGMLNSIGLANPGLAVFVAEKLPGLRSYRCPVIVNVAGASEDDYRLVVERLEEEEGLAGYEINVSCPNVRHGGLAFGTDPGQVERLTASLRSCTRRCLIVKLTPNVTDIASVARAAEAGGADALSCINTLVGMAIDVGRLRPRLASVTGGLSGPAVRPVGVACVYRAARAVTIPVIGIGGISCTEDALEYLLAGAQAVQVGTGTFVDPQTAIRVLEGIERWMIERAVSSVRDIAALLRT